MDRAPRHCVPGRGRPNGSALLHTRELGSRKDEVPMQVALVRSAAARRSLSALHVAVCVTLAVSCAGLAIAGQPQPLDPLSIPRFVEPLPMPLRVPVTSTTPAAPLEISLNEFQQQLLPASFYATLPAPYRPGAWPWCSGAAGFPQPSPGPALEAPGRVRASIRSANTLTGPGQVVHVTDR